MAETPPTAPREGLASRLARRLLPMREQLAGGIATTLNSALQAAGLNLQIEAPPQAAKPTPPPPAPGPGTTAGPGGPYSFTASVGSRPQFTGAPRPAASPPGFAQPLAVKPKAPVRGPTPMQVMNAVQGAVVGAVKVVSGTYEGVKAAGEAARAASKTATGAASVASGVATVASGFFPQLAALGIGVQKAPKNRPGMRPQRRVADIIANPIGKTPPQVLDRSGSVGGSAVPPRPVGRVQRMPMVRPKSSLELKRKEKAHKVRSYSDLQMRPQLGLTPHEILLKVATLALGKTLLGFLESGARAQQQALQRVNERMSQKQIMLLGMLPAQYVVARLPPQPADLPPAPEPAPQASQPTSPIPAAGPPNPSGSFKIRY